MFLAKVCSTLTARKFDTCGKHFQSLDIPTIFKNRSSEIHIGENVLFGYGVRVSMGGSGTLTIGDNSYLGDRAHILCNRQVAIGRNCAISWEVLIMDYPGYETGYDDEEPIIRAAPVIVEDDVWIGCRSIVIKGVRIGTGAIVSAGSLVVKDVPPHTLVGGNPARILRENAVWSKTDRGAKPCES
jgi:acetyltransferase-like isoleucine patch superfamily enzyme